MPVTNSLLLHTRWTRGSMRPSRATWVADRAQEEALPIPESTISVEATQERRQILPEGRLGASRISQVGSYVTIRN